MINTIRITVYVILVSFFSSVIYNAFLFPKGVALYKYLFETIDSNIEIVFYYLIKGLPAIILNFFVILILKALFDVKRAWIVFTLYILSFLGFETLFFYFINRMFFEQNNNIYHYSLSFITYSISLWALTFTNNSDKDVIDEN